MPINEFIKQRLKQKPICLMTHMIAGYPSFDDNLRMLDLMNQYQVDLIEIQYPYTEPIADGPLFAKANQTAIDNGFNFKSYFEFARQAVNLASMPILMMGYYNTIMAKGHTQFLNTMKDAGQKGCIIADLPIEEGAQFYNEAISLDIDPINIVTPYSDLSRMKKMKPYARGFIYAVARAGITGHKTDFSQKDWLTDYTRLISDTFNLPVAIGFGIQKKDQIVQLHNKAQIAVIGTALLRTYESGGATGLEQFLKEVTTC